MPVIMKCLVNMCLLCSNNNVGLPRDVDGYVRIYNHNWLNSQSDRLQTKTVQVDLTVWVRGLQHAFH